jgi:taurine dioxygenase
MATENYENIGVHPISGAIGAEISGVDLTILNDKTVHEILRAFHEHLVIFFRDQTLAPEEQIEFARRFGEIGFYPFVAGMKSFPEIVEVRKEPGEMENFGGVWHSDTAYLTTPPLGATLYAKELPPDGGDTIWSNMYLAYDALSDGMKRLLAGLKGVNSSQKGAAAVGRQARRDETPRHPPDVQHESIHPVIRIHPETGRKALYVNAGHTTRFEDMTAAESEPVLKFLFKHLIRPEFTCRFRWSVGSLAVWDNRCSQHYPLNDYHGHRRVMHRVTIAGDNTQGAVSPGRASRTE